MATEQTAIQLIVGLGNPGDKYVGTRHNAGFWFVDELVRRCGSAFRPESRIRSEAAQVEIAGVRCHVLKPLSFMNRSGQPIAAVANFYRIPPEAVLVAHDELDLPPGVVRWKRGGGHGGHNGLRDTIRALGSREFQRLRIGIGHPGHADDVVPYVLSRPSPDDRRAIDEVIDEAADAMTLVFEGNADKAVQRLHSRKPET
ncbi:aminoacyl-tRNA hydrolase [Aquisalimonas asiatica]|uniref:Peptidyl-tRNA hydrolase n=1 Tax=Aquisalimonas asiatica TaxID=406100 RepID=A0A1H8VBJ1_9GAMM|nr:aminoacyl-tRNA hydrolase [Aquisalimonas asiatica]SEP12830.1 peptidyl-tRNA hydrolase [Aquisalimonas asiatica]